MSSHSHSVKRKWIGIVMIMGAFPSACVTKKSLPDGKAAAIAWPNWWADMSNAPLIRNLRSPLVR